MAELFGTAAGILQVAEVGFNLATTLYKYASTVKGAERDIKRIARDVKLTSKVLERTHEQLKADQQAQLCTNDALVDLEDVLEGCREAFKEVDDSLNKSMKPPSGKLGMSLTEKLKWPLKQDKLEVLRANLEKLKTTLLLMLSVFAYGSKIQQTQAAKTEIITGLSLEKLQIQNLIQAKDEATSRYEALSAAFSKLETRINDSTQKVPPSAASSIGPNMISMMAVSNRIPPVKMPYARDFQAQTNEHSPVSERLQICASAVSKLTNTIEAATKRWQVDRVLEHGSIAHHLQQATDAIEVLKGPVTAPALPSALAELIKSSPHMQTTVDPGHLYNSPQCVTDSNSQRLAQSIASTKGMHSQAASQSASTSPGRAEQRLDSYTGRPRRSSLVDSTQSTERPTSVFTTRSRPTVVQQDSARPASPQHPLSDYAAALDSLREANNSSSMHRKLYSVDDEGEKLVADVNVPFLAGREQRRGRRDSIVLEATILQRGERIVERGRSRRQSYVNGSLGRTRERRYDDEEGYEYTDPAKMYHDTAPRTRQSNLRRSSIDFRPSTRLERPVITSNPIFGTGHELKDVGPPPSTRGWDKIKHDGRYRCRNPACAALPGFAYPGDLVHHYREIHGKQGGPNVQMMCPHHDCRWHSGNGFTSKEILNEHLRTVHQSASFSAQGKSYDGLARVGSLDNLRERAAVATLPPDNKELAERPRCRVASEQGSSASIPQLPSEIPSQPTKRTSPVNMQTERTTAVIAPFLAEDSKAKSANPPQPTSFPRNASLQPFGHLAELAEFASQQMQQPQSSYPKSESSGSKGDRYGGTEPAAIDRSDRQSTFELARSNCRPSVSTTAPSGRTKATALSSMNIDPQIIIETPSGRRTVHWSKDDRAALIERQQQQQELEARLEEERAGSTVPSIQSSSSTSSRTPTKRLSTFPSGRSRTRSNSDSADERRPRYRQRNAAMEFDSPRHSLRELSASDRQTVPFRPPPPLPAPSLLDLRFRYEEWEDDPEEIWGSKVELEGPKTTPLRSEPDEDHDATDLDLDVEGEDEGDDDEGLEDFDDVDSLLRRWTKLPIPA